MRYIKLEMVLVGNELVIFLHCRKCMYSVKYFIEGYLYLELSNMEVRVNTIRDN